MWAAASAMMAWQLLPSNFHAMRAGFHQEGMIPSRADLLLPGSVCLMYCS
jgi:hypothetical protein